MSEGPGPVDLDAIRVATADPVYAPPAGDAGDETSTGQADRSGLSWRSILAGWSAAAGLTILGGALLATAYLGLRMPAGPGDAAALTVALVVALFVGHLVGGYAAARMAGRRARDHGLLIAGVTVAAGVVLAVAYGVGPATAPPPSAVLIVGAATAALALFAGAYLGARLAARGPPRSPKGAPRMV